MTKAAHQSSSWDFSCHSPNKSWFSNALLFVFASFGRSVHFVVRITFVTMDSGLGKGIFKDIWFICLDPLPLPHNKDMKNKVILASCLTPSLLPKIRTYEPFVFGFKKPDFASLSHNFYGVAKFENKLVKCS